MYDLHVCQHNLLSPRTLTTVTGISTLLVATAKVTTAKHTNSFGVANEQSKIVFRS